MARLSRIGRGWLETALADDNLTLADYATLEAVDAQGHNSQRDIAAAAGYDPSDITAVLDRLQERGLLDRTPDPRDRRRRSVTLTPEGRTTLRTCRRKAQQARRRLLAPLQPQQAATFEQTLATLLRAHSR